MQWNIEASDNLIGYPEQDSSLIEPTFSVVEGPHCWDQPQHQDQPHI